MRKYLKENKVELIFLFLLTALAVFFRFYRINELHIFTYDQARDALFIKRIIVDHKFLLIGPQSSIPGLFTGPAYYYLMAPFLWIFKLNPFGIDVAIAFFGVLTVVFLYYLIKIFSKDRYIAWLTALIYAVQPQIVNQSRFGWNPNTMPFFILFFLWGLFLLLRGKNFAWLIVFANLAILLQLHYSAICLLPILLIVLIYFRKQIKIERCFLTGLFLFIFLMSPLILFELRHQFINTKAVLGYLAKGASEKVLPLPFFLSLFQKIRFLIPEMVFGVSSKIYSIGILLLVFFLSGLSYLKSRELRNSLFLTLSFLIFGILVASFYQVKFFNFYLTFLYPIGFLLIGILTSFLSKKGLLWKFGFTLIFLIVFIFNLKRTDIFAESKRTINDLKLVSGVIAEDIKNGQAFNLGGILEEGGFYYNAVDYRYFLETFFKKKTSGWDVLDYQNSKDFYLISEVGKLDPLKTDIWEVNIFAPKKILKIWELPKNVVIYKLGK